MTSICTRAAITTTSAVLLLGLTASLASAEPTQMTGCLTAFGMLTSLAPGDAPARACGPKGQLVHLQLVAPLGKTAKRVFVTSQRFTGNLGGVAGAHAKCQAAADTAGLGGTWRAWISDDTISPATDPAFTKNDGPYVRLDGVMVAANWGDLIDTTILAPIAQDENGDYPGSTPETYELPPYVFTGTDSLGNSLQPDCESWTYDGGDVPREYKGYVGLYASLGGYPGHQDAYHPTEFEWTGGRRSDGQYSYEHTCYNTARLYCFQQ